MRQVGNDDRQHGFGVRVTNEDSKGGQQQQLPHTERAPGTAVLSILPVMEEAVGIAAQAALEKAIPVTATRTAAAAIAEANPARVATGAEGVLGAEEASAAAQTVAGDVMVAARATASRRDREATAAAGTGTGPERDGAGGEIAGFAESATVEAAATVAVTTEAADVANILPLSSAYSDADPHMQWLGSPLENLPVECLYTILSFFDLGEVPLLRLLSRELRAVIDAPASLLDCCSLTLTSAVAADASSPPSHTAARFLQELKNTYALSPQQQLQCQCCLQHQQRQHGCCQHPCDGPQPQRREPCQQQQQQQLRFWSHRQLEQRNPGWRQQRQTHCELCDRQGQQQYPHCWQKQQKKSERPHEQVEQQHRSERLHSCSRGQERLVTQQQQTNCFLQQPEGQPQQEGRQQQEGWRQPQQEETSRRLRIYKSSFWKHLLLRRPHLRRLVICREALPSLCTTVSSSHSSHTTNSDSRYSNDRDAPYKSSTILSRSDRFSSSREQSSTCRRSSRNSAGDSSGSNSTTGCPYSGRLVLLLRLLRHNAPVLQQLKITSPDLQCRQPVDCSVRTPKCQQPVECDTRTFKGDAAAACATYVPWQDGMIPAASNILAAAEALPLLPQEHMAEQHHLQLQHRRQQRQPMSPLRQQPYQCQQERRQQRHVQQDNQEQANDQRPSPQSDAWSRQQQQQAQHSYLPLPQCCRQKAQRQQRGNEKTDAGTVRAQEEAGVLLSRWYLHRRVIATTPFPAAALPTRAAAREDAANFCSCTSASTATARGAQAATAPAEEPLAASRKAAIDIRTTTDTAAGTAGHAASIAAAAGETLEASPSPSSCRSIFSSLNSANETGCSSCAGDVSPTSPYVKRGASTTCCCDSPAEKGHPSRDSCCRQASLHSSWMRHRTGGLNSTPAVTSWSLPQYNHGEEEDHKKALHPQQEQQQQQAKILSHQRAPPQHLLLHQQAPALHQRAWQPFTRQQPLQQEQQPQHCKLLRQEQRKKNQQHSVFRRPHEHTSHLSQLEQQLSAPPQKHTDPSPLQQQQQQRSPHRGQLQLQPKQQELQRRQPEQREAPKSMLHPMRSNHTLLPDKSSTVAADSLLFHPSSRGSDESAAATDGAVSLAALLKKPLQALPSIATDANATTTSLQRPGDAAGALDGAGTAAAQLTTACPSTPDSAIGFTRPCVFACVSPAIAEHASDGLVAAASASVHAGAAAAASAAMGDARNAAANSAACAAADGEAALPAAAADAVDDRDIHFQQLRTVQLLGCHSFFWLQLLFSRCSLPRCVEFSLVSKCLAVHTPRALAPTPHTCSATTTAVFTTSATTQGLRSALGIVRSTATAAASFPGIPVAASPCSAANREASSADARACSLAVANGVAVAEPVLNAALSSGIAATLGGSAAISAAAPTCDGDTHAASTTARVAKLDASRVAAWVTPLSTKCRRGAAGGFRVTYASLWKASDNAAAFAATIPHTGVVNRCIVTGVPADAAATAHPNASVSVIAAASAAGGTATDVAPTSAVAGSALERAAVDVVNAAVPHHPAANSPRESEAVTAGHLCSPREASLDANALLFDAAAAAHMRLPSQDSPPAEPQRCSVAVTTAAPAVAAAAYERHTPDVSGGTAACASNAGAVLATAVVVKQPPADACATTETRASSSSSAAGGGPAVRADPAAAEGCSSAAVGNSLMPAATRFEDDLVKMLRAAPRLRVLHLETFLPVGRAVWKALLTGCVSTNSNGSGGECDGRTSSPVTGSSADGRQSIIRNIPAISKRTISSSTIRNSNISSSNISSCNIGNSNMSSSSSSISSGYHGSNVSNSSYNITRGCLCPLLEDLTITDRSVLPLVEVLQELQNSPPAAGIPAATAAAAARLVSLEEEQQQQLGGQSVAPAATTAVADEHDVLARGSGPQPVDCEDITTIPSTPVPHTPAAATVVIPAVAAAAAASARRSAAAAAAPIHPVTEPTSEHVVSATVSAIRSLPSTAVPMSAATATPAAVSSTAMRGAAANTETAAALAGYDSSFQGTATATAAAILKKAAAERGASANGKCTAESGETKGTTAVPVRLDKSFCWSPAHQETRSSSSNESGTTTRAAVNEQAAQTLMSHSETKTAVSTAVASPLTASSLRAASSLFTNATGNIARVPAAGDCPVVITGEIVAASSISELVPPSVSAVTPPTASENATFLCSPRCASDVRGGISGAAIAAAVPVSGTAAVLSAALLPAAPLVVEPIAARRTLVPAAFDAAAAATPATLPFEAVGDSRTAFPCDRNRSTLICPRLSNRSEGSQLLLWGKKGLKLSLRRSRIGGLEKWGQRLPAVLLESLQQLVLSCAPSCEICIDALAAASSSGISASSSLGSSSLGSSSLGSRRSSRTNGSNVRGRTGVSSSSDTQPGGSSSSSNRRGESSSNRTWRVGNTNGSSTSTTGSSSNYGRRRHSSSNVLHIGEGFNGSSSTEQRGCSNSSPCSWRQSSSSKRSHGRSSQQHKPSLPIDRRCSINHSSTRKCLAYSGTNRSSSVDSCSTFLNESNSNVHVPKNIHVTQYNGPLRISRRESSSTSSTSSCDGSISGNENSKGSSSAKKQSRSSSRNWRGRTKSSGGSRRRHTSGKGNMLSDSHRRSKAHNSHRCRKRRRKIEGQNSIGSSRRFNNKRIARRQSSESKETRRRKGKGANSGSDTSTSRGTNRQHSSLRRKSRWPSVLATVKEKNSFISTSSKAAAAAGDTTLAMTASEIITERAAAHIGVPNGTAAALSTDISTDRAATVTPAATAAEKALFRRASVTEELESAAGGAPTSAAKLPSKGAEGAESSTAGFVRAQLNPTGRSEVAARSIRRAAAPAKSKAPVGIGSVLYKEESECVSNELKSNCCSNPVAGFWAALAGMADASSGSVVASLRPDVSNTFPSGVRSAAAACGRDEVAVGVAAAAAAAFETATPGTSRRIGSRVLLPLTPAAVEEDAEAATTDENETEAAAAAGIAFERSVVQLRSLRLVYDDPQNDICFTSQQRRLAQRQQQERAPQSQLSQMLQPPGLQQQRQRRETPCGLQQQQGGQQVPQHRGVSSARQPLQQIQSQQQKLRQKPQQLLEKPEHPRWAVHFQKKRWKLQQQQQTERPGNAGPSDQLLLPKQKQQQLIRSEVYDSQQQHRIHTARAAQQIIKIESKTYVQKKEFHLGGLQPQGASLLLQQLAATRRSRRHREWQWAPAKQQQHQPQPPPHQQLVQMDQERRQAPPPHQQRLQQEQQQHIPHEKQQQMYYQKQQQTYYQKQQQHMQAHVRVRTVDHVKVSKRNSTGSNRSSRNSSRNLHSSSNTSDCSKASPSGGSRLNSEAPGRSERTPEKRGLREAAVWSLDQQQQRDGDGGWSLLRCIDSHSSIRKCSGKHSTTILKRGRSRTRSSSSSRCSRSRRTSSRLCSLQDSNCSSKQNTSCSSNTAHSSRCTSNLSEERKAGGIFKMGRRSVRRSHYINRKVFRSSQRGTVHTQRSRSPLTTGSSSSVNRQSAHRSSGVGARHSAAGRSFGERDRRSNKAKSNKYNWSNFALAVPVVCSQAARVAAAAAPAKDILPVVPVVLSAAAAVALLKVPPTQRIGERDSSAVVQNSCAAAVADAQAVPGSAGRSVGIAWRTNSSKSKVDEEREVESIETSKDDAREESKSLFSSQVRNKEEEAAPQETWEKQPNAYMRGKTEESVAVVGDKGTPQYRGGRMKRERHKKDRCRREESKEEEKGQIGGPRGEEDREGQGEATMEGAAGKREDHKGRRNSRQGRCLGRRGRRDVQEEGKEDERGKEVQGGGETVQTVTVRIEAGEREGSKYKWEERKDGAEAKADTEKQRGENTEGQREVNGDAQGKADRELRNPKDAVEAEKQEEREEVQRDREESCEELLLLPHVQRLSIDFFHFSPLVHRNVFRCRFGAAAVARETTAKRSLRATPTPRATAALAQATALAAATAARAAGTVVPAVATVAPAAGASSASARAAVLDSTVTADSANTERTILTAKTACSYCRKDSARDGRRDITGSNVCNRWTRYRNVRVGSSSSSGRWDDLSSKTDCRESSSERSGWDSDSSADYSCPSFCVEGLPFLPVCLSPTALFRAAAPAICASQRNAAAALVAAAPTAVRLVASSGVAANSLAPSSLPAAMEASPCAPPPCGSFAVTPHVFTSHASWTSGNHTQPAAAAAIPLASPRTVPIATQSPAASVGNSTSSSLYTTCPPASALVHPLPRSSSSSCSRADLSPSSAAAAAAAPVAAAAAAASVTCFLEASVLPLLRSAAFASFVLVLQPHPTAFQFSASAAASFVRGSAAAKAAAADSSAAVAPGYPLFPSVPYAAASSGLAAGTPYTAGAASAAVFAASTFSHTDNDKSSTTAGSNRAHRDVSSSNSCCSSSGIHRDIEGSSSSSCSSYGCPSHCRRNYGESLPGIISNSHSTNTSSNSGNGSSNSSALATSCLRLSSSLRKRTHGCVERERRSTSTRRSVSRSSSCSRRYVRNALPLLRDKYCCSMGRKRYLHHMERGRWSCFSGSSTNSNRKLDMSSNSVVQGPGQWSSSHSITNNSSRGSPITEIGNCFFSNSNVATEKRRTSCCSPSSRLWLERRRQQHRAHAELLLVICRDICTRRKLKGVEVRLEALFESPRLTALMETLASFAVGEQQLDEHQKLQQHSEESLVEQPLHIPQQQQEQWEVEHMQQQPQVRHRHQRRSEPQMSLQQMFLAMRQHTRHLQQHEEQRHSQPGGLREQTEIQRQRQKHDMVQADEMQQQKETSASREKQPLTVWSNRPAKGEAAIAAEMPQAVARNETMSTERSTAAIHPTVAAKQAAAVREISVEVPTAAAAFVPAVIAAAAAAPAAVATAHAGPLAAGPCSTGTQCERSNHRAHLNSNPAAPPLRLLRLSNQTLTLRDILVSASEEQQRHSRKDDEEAKRCEQPQQQQLQLQHRIHHREQRSDAQRGQQQPQWERPNDSNCSHAAISTLLQPKEGTGAMNRVCLSRSDVASGLSFGYNEICSGLTCPCSGICCSLSSGRCCSWCSFVRHPRIKCDFSSAGAWGCCCCCYRAACSCYSSCRCCWRLLLRSNNSSTVSCYAAGDFTLSSSAKKVLYSLQTLVEAYPTIKRIEVTVPSFLSDADEAEGFQEEPEQLHVLDLLLHALGFCRRRDQTVAAPRKRQTTGHCKATPPASLCATTAGPQQREEVAHSETAARTTEAALSLNACAAGGTKTPLIQKAEDISASKTNLHHSSGGCCSADCIQSPQVWEENREADRQLAGGQNQRERLAVRAASPILRATYKAEGSHDPPAVSCAITNVKDFSFIRRDDSLAVTGGAAADNAAVTAATASCMDTDSSSGGVLSSLASRASVPCAAPADFSNTGAASSPTTHTHLGAAAARCGETSSAAVEISAYREVVVYYRLLPKRKHRRWCCDCAQECLRLKGDDA